MWFHFWIAFHLCVVVAVTTLGDVDVVVVAAIISSMMQSTLTLKIDKVDVSMVFVAHSYTTHIILYKLEIFGLDFSAKIFFVIFKLLFRTLTPLILFIYFSLSLILVLIRTSSICDTVVYMHFAVLITNDYLILMWNM